MINVQFSSNNANNQIRMANYSTTHREIVSNNFKCNKADNTIKIKKTRVLLGDRVKLWD